MTLIKFFLPEFFLSLSSIFLLIVNIVYIKNPNYRYLSWLLTYLVTAIIYLFTPFASQLSTIGDNFVVTKGLFFIRVFLIISLLLIYLSVYRVIMSSKYLAEFSFFLSISVSFLSFLTSTKNLFVAFVLIESISFGFYILVGIYRNNLASVEAGLKYFYLGTFSSLIFFTGLFMFYLASLDFSLLSVSKYLTNQTNMTVFYIGLTLILISIIFKLGGAPFQFWLPEVYQGSPLVVFPLLIAISKLGIGIFFINTVSFLSNLDFHTGYQSISNVFLIVSLLSMIIGNLLALRQQELKRLLAYSSIAHVGYFLSLFSVIPTEFNLRILGGYLFIYALTNLSFLVAFQIKNPSPHVKIPLSDYEALLPRCPVLLFSMLVSVLSLAGLPPTAGFVTKLFVLLQLIKNGSYFLALIFLIASILSIYYYFKLINPILRALRGMNEIVVNNAGSDIREGLLKIILLVISFYLIFSVFKPDYIFFM